MTTIDELQTKIDNIETITFSCVTGMHISVVLAFGFSTCAFFSGYPRAFTYMSAASSVIGIASMIGFHMSTNKWISYVRQKNNIAAS